MSNPIVIGDAVTVHVRAPSVPQWRTEPPANAPDVHVVPVVGPPGPEGQPGPGGAADQYVHEQVVPQSVWQVGHQLGRYPAAWSLFDDEGRECGQYVVQHLDEDTLRVTMDIPTAGLFRCI